MAQTSLHAGWLLAALTVLAGYPAAHTSAADPQPTGTISVVAQSTRVTAGTGRRPIGERIAASNLPHRTPSAPLPPPEAAPEPPVPDEPSAEPEPALAGSDDEPFDREDPPEAEEHELEPLAAEPELLNDPSEALAAEAAVVTLPAPLAETPEVQPVAAEIDADEIDAVDDTEPLAEATPAAPPAPAAPQPRPSDAIRRKLLDRIKGAFAARPRAGAAPGSPSGGMSASPELPTPDGPPPGTAAVTAAAPATAAVVVPARLEFDVRESRSLVGEGEQIVMRIAVRNVGGAAAEGVATTLFFADGMEPVQAIGHTADVYPGEVRFAAVPELAPGSSIDMLVTAVGTRPGSVAYRGELTCGQLAGPIAREGAVTVQPRRPVP